MSKAKVKKADCKPVAKQPPARIEDRGWKLATSNRAILRTAVRLFLLSVFSFQLCSARAAYTVTGLVNQVTSQALNTYLSFHPWEDVLLLNNGLSAGPAKTIHSTNGAFSVTLDAGRYLVRLPLVPTRNPFTIAVPNGTSTTDITNLIAEPWTYAHFLATLDGGSVSESAVAAIMATNNSATAITATNAPNGIQVASTNQIDPLRALLWPRQSGAVVSTPNFVVAQKNAGFVYLQGSGTIRAVWSVPEMGHGWTNAPNDLRLQIFTDIGSNTNPPTAGLKQLEIPLKDLFMNNYRFVSNGQYQVLLDSDWLLANFASTNLLAQHEVGQFDWRFPCHYTNGALIRITNAAAANLLGTNGYLHVTYSSGAPLEYPAARLKNLRFSGAITGSASNYLGTVTGTGAIVGIMMSQLAAESPDGVTSDFVNWQDSNAIRIDVGSGGHWEAIGSDDLFFNTFGSVLGEQSGDNSGTVNIVPDPVMTAARGDRYPMGAEQFRWLTTDAIWFTNGFHASVRPYGSLLDLKCNLIYYTIE